jgi:hypothetical protein
LKINQVLTKKELEKKRNCFYLNSREKQKKIPLEKIGTCMNKFEHRATDPCKLTWASFHAASTKR